MPKIALFLIGTFFAAHAAAQNVWIVPRVQSHIQMDGRLDDWQGIAPVVLEPSGGAARSQGDFTANDLRLSLRAAWKKDGFYMALEWEDNSWDVEEVSRNEANWIDPEGKRRNRMVFFDYMSLQLRRSNMHYTVWVSPRANEKGPYTWAKLFGKKRMELAGTPPLISTFVSDDGRCSMELLFQWKDMLLKPKSYKDLLVRIDVADSDLSGQPLESKVEMLKSLQWVGLMTFAKK
ncbi:MAG: hypothetical protein V3T83_16995 [Acidobacteriota bacterium]